MLRSFQKISYNKRAKMPNEIRDIALEITRAELEILIKSWEARTITHCEIFSALFCKAVQFTEDYQEHPRQFLENLIRCFYEQEVSNDP
jgi:hypothetical protein